MYKTLTIEDLLDRQQELHRSRYDEDHVSWYEIISVQEELYKRISADKNSEYATSLNTIKANLVSYLIRYGTYLKTEYRKDDIAAISTLNKALRYERDIPIAHFRLGFLTYKKKSYLQALLHFQNALKVDEKCTRQEYKLTKQQSYNANLYLANSALYIAGQAQQSMKGLELEEVNDSILHYERSPLYEVIQQNENYLEQNAFSMTTTSGVTFCSKEKGEEVAYSFKDTLVLYFSDRQTFLHYNGREETLSINHAEMLRYLLLHSENQNVATKDKFYDLFQSGSVDGQVPDNTFVQAVSRMRRKLNAVGIPTSVIQHKSINGQTSYYFNQSMLFVILHRSDESFILSE